MSPYDQVADGPSHVWPVRFCISLECLQKTVAHQLEDVG
jgi:hypothetical protein